MRDMLIKGNRSTITHAEKRVKYKSICSSYIHALWHVGFVALPAREVVLGIRILVSDGLFSYVGCVSVDLELCCIDVAVARQQRYSELLRAAHVAAAFSAIRRVIFNAWHMSSASG